MPEYTKILAKIKVFYISSSTTMKAVLRIWKAMDVFLSMVNLFRYGSDKIFRHTVVFLITKMRILDQSRYQILNQKNKF